jgi:hypothetical protein
MDKKIRKIAIMDFDQTLVNTPTPENGKEKYKEKTGSPWPYNGWWSKKESLDLDIFDMSVVDEVIKDYHIEKQKDDTLVVMLTGRLVKLSEEVEKVLDAKGLEFDEYHYNKGGSTDIAKMKTMESLLEKYPTVDEIQMWDDRILHIPIFEQWGKEQCLNGKLKDFSITVVLGGHEN